MMGGKDGEREEGKSEGKEEKKGRGREGEKDNVLASGPGIYFEGRETGAKGSDLSS